MEISVAVIIAAVLSMVLGSLWYSPLLFARPWMKLVGKSEADKSGGKAKIYLAAFGANLVIAFVLSQFISLTGVKTPIEGAKVGLWAGLGFVAPATLIEYLFEEKQWKLYWINTLYQLLVLVVMGAVLAVWG